MNHRKAINKFYKGFPHTGYYFRTLCRSLYVGKKILNENGGSVAARTRRVRQCATGASKDATVVFDFDDTLVFYRSHDPLVGRIRWIAPKARVAPLHGQSANGFCEPIRVLSWSPIEPIIKLFQYARRLGYRLVIVTQRKLDLYFDSLEDCRRYDVVPDLLFMRPGDVPLKKGEVFKRLGYPTDVLKGLEGEVDKLLEMDPKGGNVILSVGDQWEDVNGDIQFGIKLPDSYDMNAYLVKGLEKEMI